MRVRIVLDGSELPYEQSSEQSSRAFQMLVARPGVEVRVKHDNGEILHLKSYTVDGRWHRDGSANLTPTGLQKQDNSLITMDSGEAAAAFERKFNRHFGEGETLAEAATSGRPPGWIPGHRD